MCSIKKKNKKGITLVELVAVLAVLAVVGTLAGTLIYTMSMQYKNVMQVNVAKRSINTMMIQIETELRYTDSACINTDTAGTHTLYSADGKIYKDGAELYTEPGFYGGLQYFVTWSVTGTSTVQVEIAARDSGGKSVFSNSSAVKLLNVSSVAATGAAAENNVLHYS